MEANDQIARLHRLASYAELLQISEPLPMMPGETVQSYLARDASGCWFIWEDLPAAAWREGNGGGDGPPQVIKRPKPK